MEISKHIGKALQVLQEGGVIAYPTETVYGLGCDPRDEESVKRIFRIKKREAGKPVLLVAGSLAQVRHIVRLEGKTLALAQRFWPGALTLVLPVLPGVGLAKRVVLRGEVAIRFSTSPIVQKLTRRYGFPIVSTSANLSGEPACMSVKEIETAFAARRHAPDFVFNGGRLPARKASTIIRVSMSGEGEILRQGAVRIPRSMLK
jgi:L-threonylcarbamoyladenylate synthase